MRARTWIVMPQLSAKLCAAFPGVVKRIVGANMLKQLRPGSRLDPDWTPRYSPW